MGGRMEVGDAGKLREQRRRERELVRYWRQLELDSARYWRERIRARERLELEL